MKPQILFNYGSKMHMNHLQTDIGGYNGLIEEVNEDQSRPISYERS